MTAEQTLSNDVLLLMLDLSRLQDHDRIITQFLDTINARSLGVHLRHTECDDETGPISEEIATLDSRFGFIAFDGDVAAFEPDVMPVLRNAVRMLAIVLEKRRQDENLRKLRRSLQRTASEREEIILRTATDGFCFVDTTGAILEVNDAYCDMVGYARDELLYMNVRDLEVTETPEEIAAHLHLIRESGGHRFETRHRCKNGTVIDLDVTATYMDHDGGRIFTFFRDITDRKRAEEALLSEKLQSEEYINSLPGLFYVFDEKRFVKWNSAWSKITGYSDEELGAMYGTDFFEGEDRILIAERMRKVFREGESDAEAELVTKDGQRIPYFFTGVRKAFNGTDHLVGLGVDNTERKRAEDAIERRIVALTQPLDDASSIAFEELFNLDDIQRLQDEFSKATGVASIITHVDGSPITAPSNFCRLCSSIIRKTEKGLANCYKSDAALGRFHPAGPIIQPCLSGGLWDAGAAISVGGKHIANWLIGQVRDETQTEDKMRAYARNISTDEETFVEAFREVPAMSREQFGDVSQVLFTLANQLSTSAYQNVQQARFITDRVRMEEALQTQMETQKFLLSELDHRVRNNLSSLLTLIDLSRGGDDSADKFADAIRARTQAIASVHSILSDAQWRGCDLERMIRTVVQPPHGTRIHIEGPELMIPLAQTQALGLVINELATNSLKYGAMTAPAAAVSITWSIQKIEHGQTRLTLSWRETDGPIVEREPEPGTGTRLIEGLTHSELQGRAELTYPPEGAAHTLTITLTSEATAQFSHTGDGSGEESHKPGHQI